MNSFVRLVITLPLLIFFMLWLIVNLLILVLGPQSIGLAESISFSLSATIGIPIGFIGLLLSKFIAVRESTNVDAESNILEDNHENGFKSLWEVMKIEVKILFLASATIFLTGTLNALFMVFGNMMKI